MRKALSIILCLCIVLSVFAIAPFNATAAENEITETGATSGTTGDCRWSLNGTELTISGNGEMESYSSYFTLPWGKSITKVTITDGVTNVGWYAFYNCSSLTSVTIPDSVTSIGSDAFSGCSSLTSVTIPDSVTSIKGWAFYGCTSLTSVTIPDSVTSIGGSAFSKTAWYNNQPDGLVYAGKVAYKMKGTYPAEVEIKDGTLGISDNAFRGCTSLTSVTIPDSVTSIGHEAFYNCSSLTSIDIPDSVTSIGDYTFSGCTSLTSVTIPDSVTSINWYAFYGCTSLTSVTIPDSVTSIGSSVFSSCRGLTNITVSKNNAVYDSRNNCNAIIETKTNTIIAGCKNTVIPDSVTSIGSYAFSGCSSLTSVTIPDSVTSISERAFSGCSGLTNITVSENNAVYDSRNNCNAIIETKTNTLLFGCMNTVIPNSVTSIKGWAFYGCNSLTSVTIPDSVTSIESDAFSGCSSLTSVYIPNSVTSIGENAFGYYYDNGFKKIDGFTICGFTGTEAEIYANSNNITFIPVTFGQCCNCHSLVKVFTGYPETCTVDGLTDGYTCNSCGYQQVQSVIPAHGHKPIIDKAVETTCQHAGHTVGSYCEYCGEVYVQSQVIPQLPHTPVTDPAVEATCTRTGLTEGSHCSVCGDTIIQQKTIAMLPHTAGEMVIENDVPVTCTTSGSHDEVVYCTVCKNEISRNTVTTKALGHNYEIVSGKPATYLRPGHDDGVRCTRCNEWLIEPEEYPILAGNGIFCDVDSDGEVTALDATYILRNVAKIEIPFVMDEAMGDADGDNLLTVMDATAIQRYLASLKSFFGIGITLPNENTDRTFVSSIDLSDDNATIIRGQKVQISAAVSPENADSKALLWTSSDPSVAIVDQSGNVSAVNEGTATIYATATDGSGVKGSCTITVEGIKVSSITLSSSNLNISKGQSKTLTATIAPSNADNKSLQWSSSDTSVATVDQNGKVTAVKGGTATIYATATDGSGTKGSCAVSVEEINVSDITLSPVSLTMTKGQSKTLSATVSPSNAQNKTLQWISSNDTVVSVDQSGKVTALKAGTAYIYVKATDGSKKISSCPVLVSDPNSANKQLESYNKVVHYIRTNPTGIDDDGNPYISQYDDYSQTGYQFYSITAMEYGGLAFYQELQTTKSGLTSTGSVYLETNFNYNYTIEPYYSFSVTDSILGYINGCHGRATIDARNYSKNTTLSFSGLSYDDNKTANTSMQLAFTSWQLMLMTKCSTNMKDIGFSSFTL